MGRVVDINLRLLVEDEELVDTSSSTGLTQRGYSQLIDTLADLGFGIVAGPEPQPTEPEPRVHRQRKPGR